MVLKLWNFLWQICKDILRDIETKIFKVFSCMELQVDGWLDLNRIYELLSKKLFFFKLLFLLFVTKSQTPDRSYCLLQDIFASKVNE